MVDIEILFSVYGNGFSPSVAEEECGILFTSKIEPGTPLRNRGIKESPGEAKYKYGGKLIDLDSPLPEFFGPVQKLVQCCRRQKPERMELWIYITYEAQCNLVLDPKFAEELARIGLPVLISVICLD